MIHTPESTTHWACEKRLEEEGGKVTCCACEKHECDKKKWWGLPTLYISEGDGSEDLSKKES